MAGLLFGAALLGDRSFREEAQEHRGSVTNSVARLSNSLGDWRIVVPALSAGYLAGELAGSSDLKRVMLHAGAAAALATGISRGWRRVRASGTGPRGVARLGPLGGFRLSGEP